LAAKLLLTLILAAVLICVGIVRIFMALQMRAMGSWIAPLLGGIIAIILGGLIVPIGEWEKNPRLQAKTSVGP